MERLVFYIHGFASTGRAIKGNVLKKHFKNVFSPTLPVNCDLAIELIEDSLKLLLPFYKIVLVGSSLGGFYASYLADKYGLKAVLINPVVKPEETITKFLGVNKNFDGSTYTLEKSQVELYRKYDVKEFKNQKNFLLML